LFGNKGWEALIAMDGWQHVLEFLWPSYSHFVKDLGGHTKGTAKR